MKNFQNYYFQAAKLFEFRIKIAGYDVTAEGVMDRIKLALDAYQVETISAPKRLPIQEHKEFGKLGPCEAYIIDVAVKYPTITEQIRHLVIDRAQINADNVLVMTKFQVEQDNRINERLDDEAEAAPLLDKPELKNFTPDAQEYAGQKRVDSLMKELSNRTRQFEVAGKDKTDGAGNAKKVSTTGKTTNSTDNINVNSPFTKYKVKTDPMRKPGSSKAGIKVAK